MPSFGLNEGNLTWAVDPDIAEAMRFQCLEEGTLTALEALFVDLTPVGNVRFGIYSDAPAIPSPDSLLLDAGITPVTNGWVSITGLTLALTAGRWYWLCYLLQNQNTLQYEPGQPVNEHAWANLAWGALSDPFPAAVSYNTNKYVMRAIYTLIPAPVMPKVATLPAVVSGTRATLNGYLTDDNGKGGECRFQYGPSAQYGSNTPWVSGYTSGDTFYDTITGLAGGEGYHFRAHFRNANGQAYGVDQSLSVPSSGTRGETVNAETLFSSGGLLNGY